jgi:DNA invertase Pin-like site-specific DNA recombinase
VDTSISNGRLFLNIMASLAEYEKELIRERTNAGLSAARARGRLGGRPKGLKAETINKLKMMRSLLEKPDPDYEAIYTSLGISRANFYRYLKLLETHSDNELNQLKIKK